MLRICAVLVAGATALQAPRQPLSTAPSWLQAATLEQPPASTSKDLLPRERPEWRRARGTCFCAFTRVEWVHASASDASERQR